MKSNHTMRTLALAFALVCLVGMPKAQAQAGNSATAVKQPISLKGLTAALEDGGASEQDIVEQIKQRGVNFRVTKEAEEQLRSAKAPLSVISAVRDTDGPISLKGLMAALESGGASELDLDEQIKQRGVRFLFTKDAQEQLRSAKAPLTVVNAVRENFSEDPASSGSREVSSAMASAACKMPEDQLSSAVIKVNEAIQTDPDNPAAYRCRAILYAQQKRYDDSLQDMELIVTAEPGEYKNYYLRAYVYFYMQNYLLCVKDLNSFLDHDRQADAYDLRGRAYYALKRYDSAVNDYDDAIRLKPDQDGFYIHRAVSRSGAGDKNAALSDCNSALRIAPKNASYLHFRGDLKESLGDHPGAVDDWRAARQLGDTTVSEKAVQEIWTCSLNKADYTISSDSGTVYVTPLQGGFRASLQIRRKGNKSTYQGRWTIDNTTAYIEFTNWSDTKIDGYLFQPSSNAANCSTKTQTFFQIMSGVNDSNQPTCTRYEFSFVRKQ